MNSIDVIISTVYNNLSTLFFIHEEWLIKVIPCFLWRIKTAKISIFIRAGGREKGP